MTTRANGSTSTAGRPGRGSDPLPLAAWIFAHPLRPKILRLAAVARTSPGEIASDLDQALGVVAYHVRQLADAGVLRRAGIHHARGAIEHFYRTDTDRLRELAETLEREIRELLEGAVPA